MAVSMTTARTGIKARRRRNSRQKNGWAYLFLAPQLVGLLLFTVVPTLATIALSFTNFRLGGTSDWVGFENYLNQLSDPVLLKAATNTVVFTLMYVPAVVVAALTVSLLFLRVRRGRAVYQTAYFMPLVTSTAATSLVWALVFQPDYGLANKALEGIGLPVLRWYSSPDQALPTLVLIVVWATVGNSIILFTAGIQSVPSHINEAAALDGATGLKRLVFITLPLISPTLFFVITITVIGSLQFFVEPFIITSGGPGNATTTVVLELYRQAFTYSAIGPAAAISCLLFVAILLLTLIQFRLSRWVSYDRD